MAGGEELQQQRDIGKAFYAIAQLEGGVKEIRVALIGIDGSNGLRGEFREWTSNMSRRMDEQDAVLKKAADFEHRVSDKFNEYLHETRPATCIGKKLVSDLRIELDLLGEKEEDRKALADTLSVELRKAQIAMQASTRNARYTMAAAVIVALVTVFGPRLF